MKVRGLITKLPGFYFSGYKNPIIVPSAVTSTAQIARLMHDYWEVNPGAEESFNKRVGFFNSTDGIPKEMLFVKLTPECTAENRQFIMNTIRSYFNDETTFFMDTP